MPSMIRQILVVVSTGTLLGGCVNTENARLGVGASTRLEGLTPGTEPHEWPKGPSLTGLARDNWAPTVIEVPVHGVAHRPSYARNSRRARHIPRQRGESPTADSCLDLVEGTQRPQRWETFRSWFTTPGQVVLMVPRMIMTSPFGTAYSPGDVHQRDWLRADLQDATPEAAEPAEPS